MTTTPATSATASAITVLTRSGTRKCARSSWGSDGPNSGRRAGSVVSAMSRAGFGARIVVRGKDAGSVVCPWHTRIRGRRHGRRDARQTRRDLWPGPLAVVVLLEEALELADVLALRGPDVDVVRRLQQPAPQRGDQVGVGLLL